MTPQEREKLESVADQDMVTWFNRTRVSESDKSLRTIPGCFYKVQAQGSATVKDSEEMNKVYKRGFVSGVVGFAHSYCLVQFLYQSRIIEQGRVPKLLFESLPYALYTLPLIGVCYYMLKEQSRVQNMLDSKYTPIWVRITEQQQL